MILALAIIFRYYPKSTGNKSKIRQIVYTKLKSSCISKEIIKRVKEQPMEWEKIFANHICNKGSISKIYKELNSIARIIIT